MKETLLWLIIGLFVVSSISLATYGMHLYALLLLFRRRSKAKRQRQAAIIAAYPRDRAWERWPMVTTQIPIYNELDVAERIIRAVAAMDYPAGRHEIQVLDDSDDRTRSIVDVTVVRRADRAGYKAGAMAYGLKTLKGEYIAIFDADFVPPRDFLTHAVALLDDEPKLACLQGRWGHLNREESWLTRAQALGIDGHFAIEQGARAWNGLMMNFNGTAGVWRRAAIEDPAVGGWSADTLTEDLDLSYRAQLAGWKLDYCFDLACPAELPGSVVAFKSQPARWATGSTPVARKLLPRIWRAPISLGKKVEATLHLTHYSVALWMLVLAVIARPMVLVYSDGMLSFGWLWVIWFAILFAAVAPSMVYVYARYSLGGRWSGLYTIPAMLVIGCGLCVNNGLAVVRGLFLRGGQFVRTPKSGSTQQELRSSSYTALVGRLWMAEILLGVYSAASFAVYFTRFHRGFSLFLLLYAMGFLLIGWLSRPRRVRTRTATIPQEPPPARVRRRESALGDATEPRRAPRSAKANGPLGAGASVTVESASGS